MNGEWEVMYQDLERLQRQAEDLAATIGEVKSFVRTTILTPDAVWSEDLQAWVTPQYVLDSGGI